MNFYMIGGNLIIFKVDFRNQNQNNPFIAQNRENIFKIYNFKKRRVVSKESFFSVYEEVNTSLDSTLSRSFKATEIVQILSKMLAKVSDYKKCKGKIKEDETLKSQVTNLRDTFSRVLRFLASHYDEHEYLIGTVLRFDKGVLKLTERSFPFIAF